MGFVLRGLARVWRAGRAQRATSPFASAAAQALVFVSNPAFAIVLRDITATSALSCRAIAATMGDASLVVSAGAFQDGEDRSALSPFAPMHAQARVSARGLRCANANRAGPAVIVLSLFASATRTTASVLSLASASVRLDEADPNVTVLPALHIASSPEATAPNKAIACATQAGEASIAWTEGCAKTTATDVEFVTMVLAFAMRGTRERLANKFLVLVAFTGTAKLLATAFVILAGLATAATRRFVWTIARTEVNAPNPATARVCLVGREPAAVSRRVWTIATTTAFARRLAVVFAPLVTKVLLVKPNHALSTACMVIAIVRVAALASLVGVGAHVRSPSVLTTALAAVRV